MRAPLHASTLMAVTFALACGDDGGGNMGPCEFATDADTPADPTVYTPRWAFEPWISKDISDRDDTFDFVGGFKERDIPVGVVVLDSPWETHYNTFVPNPDRYPEFEQMVADLREDGVRTVLWITQMVNQTSLDLEDGGDVYEGPSPNFQEARDCRFLVDKGQTHFWWKGFGAGLDFFNPEAVGWWHRQQDPLYDMGIAGWKLDFGEQYLPESFETADGIKTMQEYSEEYYRDFYAYGASKLGTDEFVTMVRPYDKSYQFEGRFFARPEHAPVGWVGDNRRDWFGLEDALDHMFRSAEAGYVMVGSDVGGYLDVDDADQSQPIPFNLDTFARWVAVGAMTPFMQLHGRANLTPWTVPDEATRFVAHYRYWSYLHSELVPFYYSLAEQAYAGGDNILRPLGSEETWAGDYRYLVGDAFLVAPILDDTGVRDIELPAGNWLDFWSTGGEPEAGSQTLDNVSVPDWERIPLYIAEGAIVPMNVRNDVTGMGTAAHAGKLTVLMVPAAAQSSFVLHADDDETTTFTAGPHATGHHITASRAHKATIFRVWTRAAANVTVDGNVIAESASRVAFDSATAPAWWYDADNRWVYISVPEGTSAVDVIIAIAGTG